MRQQDGALKDRLHHQAEELAALKAQLATLAVALTRQASR